MSNVVDLPPRKVADFIGPPVSGNTVIIDGRRIPRMVCYERGEEVEFVLDGRFGYTFPKEWAYLAAAFAAQALAVGAGFSHLGSDGTPQPFAPQVMYIGTGDTP
jgi:hypothetical protein